MTAGPIALATETRPARRLTEADRALRSLTVEMRGALTISLEGDARHEVWPLGPFALSLLHGASGRYARSAAQIERDLLDHWVVCVAPQGRHRLRIGDASITVEAGEPIILSLTQTLEGERDETSWICLFMPRDTFPELGPAIDRCCHAPLTSAAGRLLGTFLRGLGAELPGMREAELPRAVEAIRGMVTAAIASDAPGRPVDEAQVQAARLARIRAIMRQHLRSPELTPAWLCRVAGMSRSQLYRLFEQLGGVARAIQRERLREAHRVIADPLDARAIREIGEELGFPEPTAFSRAFRREFGYPPSQLRQGPPTTPAAAPALARWDSGPDAGPDGSQNLVP